MTNERKEKLLKVLSMRQNDLTVVLENVFDPHNISAVMRTCDAVGVQEIHILNTRIAPHKKWGAKSSSSAAGWLTIKQFTNAEECFSSLHHNGYTILTTHLEPGSVDLYRLDLTQKLALVFGNEHSGVSEEIIAMAEDEEPPTAVASTPPMKSPEKPAPATTKPTAAKVKPPHVKAPTKDFDKGNFYVQVGAFVKIENARLLAKAFAKRGRDVIIQQYPAAGMNLYRVMIFASTSLAEAKNYQQQMVTEGFRYALLLAR